MIWSHYHWDHVGNASLFPTSTSITVGPGFKSHQATLPGYPEDPKSPCSASDFKDRELIEISDFPTEIANLPAHDYFGDGSFYLLDTPGHCTGHICGLARVTSNPSSFIFMGGDACHFSGDLRPSSSIPLPDEIPEGVLDNSKFFPTPCPGDLFTAHHPRIDDRNDSKRTPWYEITDHPRAAYIDPELSRKTLKKMQAFDDSPDVLMIIAHDPTSLQVLPTLNNQPDEDLNQWKEKGLKEKCHWVSQSSRFSSFCGQHALHRENRTITSLFRSTCVHPELIHPLQGWLNELPRNGKPGRPPIVEGFWSEGKKWDRAKWMAEKNRQGKM